MYKKGSEKSWTGRTDAEDGVNGRRWHQIIRPVDLDDDAVAIAKDDRSEIVCFLGYCIDEGVIRNQGRPGSKDGPDEIRKYCANHAWHHDQENPGLVDGGNIYCEEGKLEDSQEEFAVKIGHLLQKGIFPVTFGGGHDIAWADFLGMQRAHGKSLKKTGIISYDAHFDLREPARGPNSGTAFYQMAEWCRKKNLPFNYLCLGIQPQSNTRLLFDRAGELNVTFLPAGAMTSGNLPNILNAINNLAKEVDEIYLTICLDVFDSSVAPGVSAPSVAGLSAGFVAEIIHRIMETGKVVVCSIAELNPLYDTDNKTARLAAFILYTIVEEIYKTKTVRT